MARTARAVEARTGVGRRVRGGYLKGQRNLKDWTSVTFRFEPPDDRTRRALY
jgi:hypothetical protein